MAITENDLKFFHAEEDSDFDTGGGQKTADVVIDGALHDLFDARAELDDVGGRVKLRKVFAQADTATTDRFQRGHVLLTEAPADDLTAATLFSTRDHFDRRPDHAAYITSYYVPAGRYNGWVYGTQVEGSRAIDLFQRVTVPLSQLPEVGATYVLIQDQGTGQEIVQYVLCTDVQYRTDTFSDSQGEFARRVITMSISARLEHDFIGSEPSRADPSINFVRAVLRKVMVAAAAEYYGTRPLASAATAESLLVNVSTPFVQLVPATSSPVAHVDLDANAQDTTLVPAADGTITVTTSLTFGAGITLSLGGPFVPNTLSITTSSGTLTDRNGTLYSGSTAIGTVDSGAGTITGSSTCPNYLGSKTAAFIPAAPLVDALQTAAILVAQNTQSLVYVLTLPTDAAPGTARVAYRALGKWYELRDGGDGNLRGDDASYGVAQLRFNTRSLTISLTTLPDVDTWLYVSWGMAGYTFHRGGVEIPKAAFELTTTNPITPGGLTITWNDGAGNRTATDDGAGGLTGDATGDVLYPNTVILRPNLLTPANTTFTLSITPTAYVTETFTSLTPSGGNYALTLAHDNVIPGSVTVSGTVNWTAPGRYAPPGGNPPTAVSLRDDGEGGFADSAGSSINYVAGTLVIHQAAPPYRGYSPINNLSSG